MVWNVKTFHTEKGSLNNEVWMEKHTFGDHTELRIVKYVPGNYMYGKEMMFSVRSSNNLYLTLKNTPLTDGERHRWNDLDISTLDRAKEIVESIKIQVEEMEHLDQVTMFVVEEDAIKFKEGQIINASFYQIYDSKDGCLVPLIVYQNEIEQTMKNNDMAYVRKGRWNQKKREEHYDNF